MPLMSAETPLRTIIERALHAADTSAKACALACGMTPESWSRMSDELQPFDLRKLRHLPKDVRAELLAQLAVEWCDESDAFRLFKIALTCARLRMARAELPSATKVRTA